MKKLFLLFLSAFPVAWATAQVVGEPPVTVEENVIKISSKRLYGKIVDAKTDKGLDAASVQLFTVLKNPATNGYKDSLIAGMLTKPNGDFSFSNMPLPDSFHLVISAVGHEQKNISGRLNIRHNEDKGLAIVEKDLGNIPLQPDVQLLGNVTVTAQKPALQMGIDRKIFDAGSSLTSAGGTALDLMKNIPSVTVDVEGNVELRNSSPQIFVDGRPTILTLDQIPAENIDRVELITNPSAKYDASSTGGIINIVLKKNKRVGFNGIVSVGAGIPDILNGDVNVNARQGKVNVFASGSYHQSGGQAKGETLRQNKQNGDVVSYFNQNSVNDRTRQFGSVRFGLDYFIDNRNTLSATQHIVKGKFGNNEVQHQEYLNSNKLLDHYGERFSDGNADFNRYSTRLDYTHKFPQPGKELSADVDYNSGGGNNNTNILNTYYYPNGSEYGNAAKVRNAGGDDNSQLTFQVDYVNPKNENTKLETGIRSYFNKQNSTFATYSQNNGTETKLPLSNNYAFDEMINAAYITYTDKWKGIGYQAGLRGEYSKFNGELLDSAQKFGYEYPNKIKNIFDAFFPSLFLSKQLNDKVELQLNYSRRIRRPDFWRLNPFIDINDPVNLRQGNPELRPEFTNSFEFNYSQQYAKGNFLGVIYYHNNQGDITQYSDTITAAQYKQLHNAAVDPNAILNTYINAQATNRLGAELTLQHKFTNNFDITPTINLQYRKVKADVGKLNLSNEGFNWESKLIVNYKIMNAKPLFNNLGFQVIGDYESPRVLPQGKRDREFDVDFAMRKEFLKKNRGSLTFSVNDVFNTERYGTIYDTPNFYQNSYGRWRVRSFRLSFSYKFGDPNFSLFKRNNMENNRDED